MKILLVLTIFYSGFVFSQIQLPPGPNTDDDQFFRDYKVSFDTQYRKFLGFIKSCSKNKINLDKSDFLATTTYLKYLMGGEIKDLQPPPDCASCSTKILNDFLSCIREEKKLSPFQDLLDSGYFGIYMKSQYQYQPNESKAVKDVYLDLFQLKKKN